MHNEAVIGKSLEIVNSDIINQPMRLQLDTCHKKEFLSSLSSIKLVLI